MDDNPLSTTIETKPSQEWIEFIDPNVAAALPPGSQIKGIHPHSHSHTSQTARIDTVQSDGSSVSFFLKLSLAPRGASMTTSALVALQTLHAALHTHTPAPLAIGHYATNPEVHFLLTTFLHLRRDAVPSAASLAPVVAALHMQAAASPTGKFGFSVPTFQGKMAQPHCWMESWEGFFAGYVRWWGRVREEGVKAGMVDDDEGEVEFRGLVTQVLERVVPRLLRPLESGGRRVVPCLVHGDLWAGNVGVESVVGTERERERVVLFDAPVLYAHNEWDLAAWRPARHKIGREYVEEYFRHVPVSEPVEDQDGRNALYCLSWEMRGAAIYPQKPEYRQYSIDIMRELLEKYPDGYEAWARERNETPAPPPELGSEA